MVDDKWLPRHRMHLSFQPPPHHRVVIGRPTSNRITEEMASSDDLQTRIVFRFEPIGIADRQVRVRLASIGLRIRHPDIIVSASDIVTVPTSTDVSRGTRQKLIMIEVNFFGPKTHSL